MGPSCPLVSAHALSGFRDKSPIPAARGFHLLDGPTIWSVLRGLDGVDDKLLEHPAFEQLPAILGNDEVPECVARNGDADIYVATDRRIIHFKTDFWKKSISKVTPYLYNDIKTFRADMAFASIGCNMTISSGVKTLPMKKGDRQRFATVVRSHVPGHQTDESISGQAPQPATSQPPSAEKKSKMPIGGCAIMILLAGLAIGGIAWGIGSSCEGSSDEGPPDESAIPRPTPTTTAMPILSCPNDAEQDYFSQIGSQGVSAFTLLTMFGEELQTTALNAPLDILDENWIYARETDIMVMNQHFDGLIALQSPASAAHIDRMVEDIARQVKQALRSTNAGIQNSDPDMLDIGTSLMEQLATKGEALRLAIDSFCR